MRKIRVLEKFWRRKEGQEVRRWFGKWRNWIILENLERIQKNQETFNENNEKFEAEKYGWSEIFDCVRMRMKEFKRKRLVFNSWKRITKINASLRNRISIFQTRMKSRRIQNAFKLLLTHKKK
jgi:hypothetical protein